MHQVGHLLGRSLFIVLVGFGFAGAASGQAETGFIDRVYRDDRGEHKYVVFVPATYSAEKRWPVVLFLHGAGERGTDGHAQVQVGLGPAVRAREQAFPFIVVFPQAEDREGPARGGWLPETADGKRALAILSEVEKEYRTDPDRVYLTGVSMGGFGAWALAAADPQRWAAIVPIAGGGDPTWANQLRRLPIWAFHGAEDRAVPPTETRRMIDALKNANVRHTEYPNVGHNSWDMAYGTDELYTWLLDQRRGKQSPAPSAPATRRQPARTERRVIDPVRDDREPFVAALEIPQAVFVRLGNEMLAALADSIPKVVTPESLSGRLPDVQQVTFGEGGSYNVRLSGIGYSGRIYRASIEARQDRLHVLLMMRLNLLIQRTYISGSSVTASAGPLLISLGSRTEMPLMFEMQPVVENRRVRFKLLDTQFRLARDNWHVGSPQWVDASARSLFAGFVDVEGRVASGLRNGLYSDPGRIEREIRAAVPRMLDRLEERINFEQVDRVVAEMWPLPVYKPRVRSWPADVRTDSSGTTLSLGISVAAFDEQQAAAGPKRIDLPGTQAATEATGRRFQFGLNPELMQPASAQMIDADVARVLVQDMPIRKLDPLADAGTLADIVPELKALGDLEIRSELVLAEPLRMKRAESNSDDAILFDLPKVKLLVDVRKPEAEKWTPFLDVAVKIQHGATPQVTSPTPTTRSLSLAWQGQANIDIEAAFADGYTPSDKTIHVDRLRQIVADGWKEWTETGPLAKVPLEDLDLGFDKLRADRTAWLGNYLTTAFGPASLFIRNRADRPLSYEMKGPYSGWGGPYTVAPGQHQRFDIAYPVLCRFRANGSSKTYTLPAGSQFEFQIGPGGQPDLYESRPAGEANAAAAR